MARGRGVVSLHLGVMMLCLLAAAAITSAVPAFCRLPSGRHHWVDTLLCLVEQVPLQSAAKQEEALLLVACELLAQDVPDESMHGRCSDRRRTEPCVGELAACPPVIPGDGSGGTSGRSEDATRCRAR